MIECRKLTKKFGEFVAVNEITFDVGKGEIFGFLGANGAGKTTAMKMLTGLLKPSGGEALVAGCDLMTESEKIKRRIGYMSQRFSLYDDLSARENLRLFGGIYGLSSAKIKQKTGEILEKLGLEEHSWELLSSLPLGWKQKLAFSAAMLHEPEIIFLDEPTGGVDPITRRQFWRMIYEAAAEGRTVFVTTHYMDEAEYCDRVSIMVDGRISALGTPAELKRQFDSRSMNEVFIKLAGRGKAQ